MIPKSAGVREVKARLSQLLRDVKRGREWVITERGKPIAKLVPAGKEELSFEERLRRLEEAGIIGPEPPAGYELPPPIPVEFGLAQRMLQEDRDR